MKSGFIFSPMLAASATLILSSATFILIDDVDEIRGRICKGMCMHLELNPAALKIIGVNGSPVSDLLLEIRMAEINFEEFVERPKD